jgi:hypothetical protein
LKLNLTKNGSFQPLENCRLHLKCTTINTLWEARKKFIAHRTDLEDSVTVAPSGRKLYYFPFSALRASPGTFTCSFLLY